MGITFWHQNKLRLWEFRKICGGTQIKEKMFTEQVTPFETRSPFYLNTFRTAATWDSIELGFIDETIPHLYITDNEEDELAIVDYSIDYDTPHFPILDFCMIETERGAVVTKLRARNCQPHLLCYATTFK